MNKPAARTNGSTGTDTVGQSLSDGRPCIPLAAFEPSLLSYETPGIGTPGGQRFASAHPASYG